MYNIFLALSLICVNGPTGVDEKDRPDTRGPNGPSEPKKQCYEV